MMERLNLKFDSDYLKVNVFNLIELINFDIIKQKRSFPISNRTEYDDYDHENYVYFNKNDKKDILNIFIEIFFKVNFKVSDNEKYCLIFSDEDGIIAEIDLKNENLIIEMDTKLLIKNKNIKKFILDRDFKILKGFLSLKISDINESKEILNLFLSMLSEDFQFHIQHRYSKTIDDIDTIKFKEYINSIYKLRDFYSESITEKEYKENIVKDNFK